MSRNSKDKRSNEKKAKQLGMAPGTASGRLRKMLLFQLIQETKKDLCFQCGRLIETVEELSIEHKTPYLNSDDPVGLFFDLNNIAFSHLSCNCRASTGGLKADPEKGIVFRAKNTNRPWAAYSSKDAWPYHNNRYLGCFATRAEAVDARKKDYGI